MRIRLLAFLMLCALDFSLSTTLLLCSSGSSRHRSAWRSPSHHPLKEYTGSQETEEKLSAASPIGERTVAKLSLSPKSIPATMEFILQSFTFPLFLPAAILLTFHPKAAKADP